MLISTLAHAVDNADCTVRQNHLVTCMRTPGTHKVLAKASWRETSVFVAKSTSRDNGRTD